MEITLTLSEALHRCPQADDWEKLCKITGMGVWTVNEGGGDIEIILTLEQAQEVGIIPRETK